MTDEEIMAEQANLKNQPVLYGNSVNLTEDEAAQQHTDFLIAHGMVSPDGLTEEDVRKAKPLDIVFAENRVEPATQERRYKICQSCPRFMKLGGICKECLCWMPNKTWNKFAECPLHHWGAVS